MFGTALLGFLVLVQPGYFLDGQRPPPIARSDSLLLRQPDSLNVRLVGNWPFGPASAVACDPDRQLVFLGSGGGVYILSVADPAHPVSLSDLIRTPGVVSGLCYASGYLYAAAGPPGLEIWDVRDPRAPHREGRLATTSPALDVTVAAPYAYVAALEGLVVADVSAPASPRQVGFCDTPGWARAVAVWKDRAYVAADYAGLCVISVLQPAKPGLIGSCTTDGYAFDVALAYSGIMVATSDDLQMFDVTNPAAPRSRWRVGTGVAGVCVSGKVVYACGYDALSSYDISDPGTPRELHALNTVGGFRRALAVSGTRAYLTTDYGGMRIVDVANPLLMKEVGSFELPYRARDVAIAGSLCYLSDGCYYSPPLRVFDASDPPRPAQLGTLAIPYPGTEVSGLAVTGQLVPFLYYGLHVADVSDPAAPRETGSLWLDGLGIAAAGTRAYVAGDSLWVIDLGDPLHPKWLGSCHLPSPYSTGIAVAGGKSYVATGESLWIADVSVPSAPCRVGACGSLVFGTDVTVQGDLAYVTDSRGLHIIAVADAAHPAEVGFCDLPVAPFHVAVSGARAWLAAGAGGLRAVDVSDPRHPREVGYYYTPDEAWSVAVSGGWVYVTCRILGIQVYEFVRMDVVEPQPPETPLLELLVMPNPASARGAVVDIGCRCADPMTIGVHDAAGRVVRTVRIASGSRRFYLETAGLPSGVYFVRVSCGRVSSGLSLTVIR